MENIRHSGQNIKVEITKKKMQNSAHERFLAKIWKKLPKGVEKNLREFCLHPSGLKQYALLIGHGEQNIKVEIT